MLYRTVHNMVLTTDNGAPTLLPALLHRGRIFLFSSPKKMLLIQVFTSVDQRFKLFNFCRFILFLVIVSPVYGFHCGRYRSGRTLSFAEYIFNYPNYQISRCQNKSKYCPPCPPLRGRLEREIEPKKYKLIHTAFSVTFLSVKRS